MAMPTPSIPSYVHPVNENATLHLLYSAKETQRKGAFAMSPVTRWSLAKVYRWRSIRFTPLACRLKGDSRSTNNAKSLSGSGFKRNIMQDIRQIFLVSDCQILDL
jgi:hypothetical protein